MKKKIISLALALVLAIGIFAVPALAATANPTAATVLVNGSNVSFDAYNINDFNYFKLRDLAYTLNGTEKQFSVGWNEANNAITLTSGQPYVSVGGEMASKGAGSKNAEPTASRIYLDGSEVQFTAYHIEGNNYFKLRDIGEAFDFGVDWDEAAATIRIDTSKGYTPEGATPTEPTEPEQPTTPTPENQGNESLVGAWSSGPETPIDRSNSWIEFRSDGTFTWQFPDYEPAMIQYRVIQGLFYWNGNYTVSGDEITVTNVQQTYTVRTGSQSREEQNKKEIAIDVWKFYFSNTPGFGFDTHSGKYPDGWEELNWLRICFTDSGTGMPSIEYTYFVQPIV